MAKNMSAPSLGPKEGFFRRNGKPQSCEPCRKSKVRCDHTFPICLRCKSRNVGAQCVFHPAPLTKPKSQYRRFRSDGTKAPGPEDVKFSGGPDFRHDVEARSRTSSDSELLVTRMNSDRGELGFPLEHSEFEKDGYEQSGEQVRLDINAGVYTKTPSPATFEPNYLGPTSYSNVFAQNSQHDTLDSTKTWQSPILNVDVERTSIDSDKVNSGARLLGLLSEISDLEGCITKLYRTRQFIFIPELLVLNSVLSIKATLQGQFNSRSYLENLSKAVFINTLRPLDFSRIRNPKLIHEMLTGPYLRWEIIGIIFTLVALAAESSSDETLRGHTQSRQHFISEMAGASDAVLSFCDSQEKSNDLIAWYQYENFLLQTSLHGDTSNFAWRRLGELATTIYALGMHQSIPASVGCLDDVTVFFRESRKKCFSAAYTLDKTIATLLGRPPRLSIQYATQPIPLNLSDMETMAEGEQLASHLSKLDVDGWNRDGVIRCCSWIRTRTLVAQVREEVLLLSLGKGVVDVETRVLDALTRSRLMWASIPPLMKYTIDSWSTRPSAKESYMLLIVYLEHLYNSFLLHRILAKQTGSNSSELYDSAWALLSVTLTLCRERDRLQGIQNQLAWTIIYNGLPSAGLLALELLRKAQAPSSYQSHLLIPRAELIRSLSVFIDSLEWVARPAQGNYALCMGSKKVLTQILDAALDPQIYRDPQVVNGGGSVRGEELSMSASMSAGSPSEDSAVGLGNGVSKEPWEGGVMLGGTGAGIGEWEARLMSMEVGMESAGTIDWDAWIST